VLNEPSVLANETGRYEMPESADRHLPETVLDQLQAAVTEVLDIYQTNLHPPPPASVVYTGRLRMDSESAYSRLDERCTPLDYQVVLTSDEQDRHVVMAIKGRVKLRPRKLWPNAVLLLLTVLSLLYVGALHEAAMQDETSLTFATFWRGWPYAASIILILGAHELGHYFAARYHRVNVTLPYFIPLPFGFFGTLGAFIQLREPMRNRKILFDVGAAGPLAGFVVAIPILMIGLATSNIEQLPDENYIIEGDSLFYATAKFAVFGRFLPNSEEDVFINQLAKAGWTGLFITGLNLIPVGQLDGGHVVFTLMGRQARRLYMPIMSGFFVLSLFNSAWWIWLFLLLFLGRAYAVPLDTVTPLDQRRRWLAYATLMIFVLVFVPNPLQFIQR
jgi:Zn-dependent protease